MKQSEPRKYLIPVLHLIVVALFIAIPILDAPLDRRGNVDYVLVTNDLSKYLLILAFFYINYFYFLPRFYFKKKYALYVLLITVSFLIIVSVPNYLRPFASSLIQENTSFRLPPPPFKPALIGRHLIHSFLSFGIAFLISFLLRITEAFSTAKVEKSNLEYTYLKAQINPHFLFNTLNALYALAIKKSEKTPEAIQELSGMMRYILHDATRDYIPLQKEIEYIDNYIQLQKHRYSYTLEIDYQKIGEVTQQKIVPLVIIPFIENAFKYGVSPEAPSKIIITISVSGQQLFFTVSNPKVAINEHSMDQSGIGLENTKARLQYAYFDKHELLIEDENETYRVKLKLDLA